MYIINKTDGTIAAAVNEGVVDTTSTDLALIGKNFTVYGELIGENFVHLLENFANDTAPPNPITGQLWYNTTANQLLVYDGINFKNISGTTVIATSPDQPADGDFWYDTTNRQLKFYANSQWNLVAPAYTNSQGLSGIVVETVNDNTGSPRVITSIYNANTRVAILSGVNFTPSTTIGGFTDIQRGINLIDLSVIGGLSYLKSDDDTETTGQLTISNDNGLLLGANLDLSISVDSTSVDISSDSDGKHLNFFVTDDASNTNLSLALYANTNAEFTGEVSVDSLYTETGILTNGDILPVSDQVNNIGSPGQTFDTVYATTLYGTSLLSQYADIAECYTADSNYEPGTVVDFGGDYEVTISKSDSSSSIAGVITTSPAHLMNNKLAGDNIAPVALLGRVPCKVVGPVLKGQMLVSAGNGRARAELSPAIGTVIGKAIQNNLSGEGVIEIVVGRI